MLLNSSAKKIYMVSVVVYVVAGSIAAATITLTVEGALIDDRWTNN